MNSRNSNFFLTCLLLASPTLVINSKNPLLRPEVRNVELNIVGSCEDIFKSSNYIKSKGNPFKTLNFVSKLILCSNLIDILIFQNWMIKKTYYKQKKMNKNV